MYSQIVSAYSRLVQEPHPMENIFILLSSVRVCYRCLLWTTPDQCVHHAVVPHPVCHLSAQGSSAQGVGCNTAGGIRGSVAHCTLPVGQACQVGWTGAVGQPVSAFLHVLRVLIICSKILLEIYLGSIQIPLWFTWVACESVQWCQLGQLTLQSSSR